MICTCQFSKEICAFNVGEGILNVGFTLRATVHNGENFLCSIILGDWNAAKYRCAMLL